MRLTVILIAVVLPAFSDLPALSVPAPQESFRIAGTVVNSVTGEPLAGIQVEIRPDSKTGTQVEILPDPKIGTVVATTSTAGGSFAFQNVIPGKYLLSASGRAFAKQSYQEHDAFSTAIVVGPDLDSENLVFRLTPDASISGQVVDEMSDAVRNARVMLFRKGEQDGRAGTYMRTQAETDDEGTYDFGHLQPGTYFVVVSAEPWYTQYLRQPLLVTGEAGLMPSNLDFVYPLTFYSDATDEGHATPIVLDAGERETADMTLMAVPAVHISLDVANAANDSPQPFTVRAQRNIFDGYADEVAVQGRHTAEVFEIDSLPTGPIELRVDYPDGQNRITHFLAMDASSATEIDVKGASAAATVSGVVRFENALPLHGQGLVTLQNTANGQSEEAQIAPDGKFQFTESPIAPGRYAVRINGERQIVVAKMEATGAKASGENIDVSGGDVQLSIVAAEAAARVDGFAYRGGKPVSGAMILLVPNDPENNQSLFRRDESNSDGSFTLADIAAGNYTVVAIEKGWDLEWSRADVIQKYLAGGQAVRIEPAKQYNLKLNVQ